MEDLREVRLNPLHQVFVDRFIHVCQADERVLLEDFGTPDIAFHIYADGTEGRFTLAAKAGWLSSIMGPFTSFWIKIIS